jgi:hypothetical protein
MRICHRVSTSGLNCIILEIGEARDPKSETISKSKILMLKTFEFGSFDIRICFEFRISCFGFIFSWFRVLINLNG